MEASISNARGQDGLGPQVASGGDKSTGRGGEGCSFDGSGSKPLPPSPSSSWWAPVAMWTRGSSPHYPPLKRALDLGKGHIARLLQETLIQTRNFLIREKREEK